MKLTLIRNGETVENEAHVFQGHSPGQLSELGKKQAADAALQLADRHFDSIYCSDLQRCLDTAEPIRARFPDVPFYPEPRLRERSCGDWTGKVADDMMHEWHALEGDEFNRRMPGGESWNDVTLRVAPLLNELFERFPEQHILIITHGGPVRSIRSLIEHRPLSEITIGGTANGGMWETEMLGPVNAGN